MPLLSLVMRNQHIIYTLNGSCFHWLGTPWSYQLQSPTTLRGMVYINFSTYTTRCLWENHKMRLSQNYQLQRHRPLLKNEESLVTGVPTEAWGIRTSWFWHWSLSFFGVERETWWCLGRVLSFFTGEHIFYRKMVFHHDTLLWWYPFSSGFGFWFRDVPREGTQPPKHCAILCNQWLTNFPLCICWEGYSNYW